MLRNLTHATKTFRALAPVAAGATDQQSSWIDTLSADAVRFIVSFGAIVAGAATAVKLQYSDDGSNSAGDVAGSSQTVVDTDDNTLVIAELFKPQKRYVRAYISRATQNSTIDLVVAEVGLLHFEPATQPADVSHSVVLNNKPVGTA